MTLFSILSTSPPTLLSAEVYKLPNFWVLHQQVDRVVFSCQGDLILHAMDNIMALPAPVAPVQSDFRAFCTGI